MTSQETHEIFERLQNFYNRAQANASILSFLQSERIQKDTVESNEVFYWLLSRAIRFKPEQKNYPVAFALQMIESSFVTKDYLKHYKDFIIPDRRGKSFLRMAYEAGYLYEKLVCKMLSVGFDPSLSTSKNSSVSEFKDYNLLDAAFKNWSEFNLQRPKLIEIINCVFVLHPNLTPALESSFAAFVEYKRDYIANRSHLNNSNTEEQRPAIRARL